MRKFVRRVKKYNPVAKIAGLDIGRRFIGIALSDKAISRSLPFSSANLVSGIQLDTYPKYPHDFEMNKEFYVYIKKMIVDYHVKGLIVGYPLLNNKPTKHCYFIEDFVKYLIKNQGLKVPITFVNEEFSTIQAKKAIEFYQVEQNNYDPKFVRRKKLNDQVAATIILDKFIDFYHEDKDDLLDEKEEEEYKEFYNNNNNNSD